MLPFQSALVTGATGFVGGHLVRRLIAEGVTTYCLVRARSLTAEVQQRLAPGRCLALCSDSLADWRQALKGVEAEVVFHLASPGVLTASQSPESLVRENVRLVSQLLQAVAHWPPRQIVQTGSFSEYKPLDQVLTEDALLVPTTPYGASKVAAWLCGRALATLLGLPLTNLRLFHVYGPGEAPGRLIPHLHERLSRGLPAPLTGGQQVRDLVYIDDVIDALLAAASLPPASRPIAYNVCSGEPVTIRQIGETVAERMHAPQSLLRWGELPYRPGEPMRAVGDNRRFTHATGWRPRVGLEDGIARTLVSLSDGRQMRLAG
jgi:nucleoside-diphosphate-sugar epimerase